MALSVVLVGLVGWSHLQAAGQDAFSRRGRLTGLEDSDSGDFSTATQEFNEPELPGSTAGRSLWWTWTAPEAGEVQVELMGFPEDFSTELDTVLAVFQGNTLATLQLIEFNDDTGRGLSSRCTFRAEPGVTFQFMADLSAFESATGIAFLSVTLEPDAAVRPDNDAFLAATPLTGSPATDESTFKGATWEVGEPTPPFPFRGRSLWWSWTAPDDGLGIVGVRGIGLGLDTVMAVYTGTGLTGLQRVASNDDGGVDGSSEAVFAATAGTTYYIQADLYDDGDTETGPVQINAELEVLPPVEQRPANDAFANAAALAGTAGTAESNTQYATGEPLEPSTLGGIRSRSVWWKWTAPRSGVLRVRTHGSTTASGAPLDTVLAVFSGRTIGNLEELDSSDDAGSLLTSEATAYVTAGAEYFIGVGIIPGTAPGTVRLAFEWAEGVRAPSWTAYGLDNAAVRSSQFDGSVRLVNFWATWCGPCLAEIPDLISLHEQYRDQGFEVIGISVDDPVAGTWPTSLVTQFVQDYGISYPVLMDRPSGTADNGFGHADAIPTTYVINREGLIVQKWVGTRSRSTFEKTILPLLSTTPAVPPVSARALEDGRIELSWEPQSNLQLESGSTLGGPWNVVAGSPTDQGGRRAVTVSPDTHRAFYRLNRP